MKTLFFSFVILLLNTFPTFALSDSTRSINKIKPNSIQVHFGDYYIPRTEHPGRYITQVGINVSRLIYKNISVGLGYSQWKNFKSSINEYTILTDAYYANPPVVGSQHLMREYKMFDIWIAYKIRLRDNHIITPVLGVSHCWGTDQYLLFHYMYGFEPHSGYDWRKASYNGGMGGVSYDYFLMKNILNIGADIKFRLYPNRIRQQYDYGMHIGVNF